MSTEQTLKRDRSSIQAVAHGELWKIQQKCANCPATHVRLKKQLIVYSLGETGNRGGEKRCKSGRPCYEVVDTMSFVLEHLGQKHEKQLLHKGSVTEFSCSCSNLYFVTVPWNNCWIGVATYWRKGVVHMAIADTGLTTMFSWHSSPGQRQSPGPIQERHVSSLIWPSLRKPITIPKEAWQKHDSFLGRNRYNFFFSKLLGLSRACFLLKTGLHLQGGLQISGD